jgi:hypothetical protein
MTRRSAPCAALALAFLLFASSLHAQVLAPGNRPPLSPWFGLYQRNGGPLDNYHTFVQPRIQLDNTLQGHQAAIQRNNAGVTSLGRELSQFTEQDQVHPTGTNSVFMHYSHYYPAQGGGGRAMQGAARARRVKPAQPASSSRAMAAAAH